MDIIATTYWWAWPARNSLARSTHDGPWRKNNSSSSFFSIIKADKYKYNIDKYEIDILSNHETFLQSKKVSEAGSAVKQGGSSSHKENDCVQMSGFNASATSDIAYNAIVETVAHAKDNPKKASASHRSAVVSTKVGAHGGEAEILLKSSYSEKRFKKTEALEKSLKKYQTDAVNLLEKIKKDHEKKNPQGYWIALL